MYFIVADVQITRRKRVHLVLDENNEVAFAAARLTDVLAWLHDRDLTQITIQDQSERLWSVDIHHIDSALVYIAKMKQRIGQTD